MSLMNAFDAGSSHESATHSTFAYHVDIALTICNIGVLS